MQAKLRLLQAGPRPERVAAQRELVGLTEAWRNQAQHELQQAIEKDVQRIAMKINEYRARMKLAREEFELSKRLIQATTLHTWNSVERKQSNRYGNRNISKPWPNKKPMPRWSYCERYQKSLSASRTSLKHTPH